MSTVSLPRLAAWITCWAWTKTSAGVDPIIEVAHHSDDSGIGFERDEPFRKTSCSDRVLAFEDIDCVSEGENHMRWLEFTVCEIRGQFQTALDVLRVFRADFTALKLERDTK